MIFLFSYAIASSEVTTQNNPYSLVVMLILFIIIFYFVIFRPQQKRNKAHKNLINSISKDDEILTNSGLVGKVIKITETGYVFISSDESHKFIIKRDCIINILPKGTIKTLLMLFIL